MKIYLLLIVVLSLALGGASLLYLRDMTASQKYLADERSSELRSKSTRLAWMREREAVANALTEVCGQLFYAVHHADEAQRQADAGQPITAGAELVAIREKLNAIGENKDPQVQSAVERATKALATGLPGVLEGARDAVRVQEEGFRNTYLPETVRVEVVR